MKVSIITRHAIPNYGSILQSYASQKIFENLGWEAEILDYIRYDERGKQSVLTNCHIGTEGLKNKIKRMIYFCLQYPNSQKMNTAFEQFRKQYLRLSTATYGSVAELKENLPDADVFVTGSDQVWGKIGGAEYDGAYFLDFVPENVPQIAFSASFGKTDLNEELEKNLQTLLQNYDSLLVREKSAVELIEQHTGKTAQHILDPTLLLDRKEWETLCEPTGLEGKDYIFVYQLHHNKQMERYITKLQKETGLPVYRVHPSIFYALKPGQFIHLPTPGQFLSYIKNAKYMVTDSFHGTVFSMIFNTQFVDIIPALTGTRIESLLELTGLQHRSLKDLGSLGWMEQRINFGPVNAILELEKGKTRKALRESLPKLPNTVQRMNLHTRCAGCSACAAICPKNAITMAEDAEGFRIPRVDKTLCVECGLCVDRCPQLAEKAKNNHPQTGYAAKLRNRESLLKSASGGVFYGAAKQILDRGGVVYGAAMGDDLTVSHLRVTEEDQLQKLRGSKYVQSHMNDTLRRVRRDLREGKTVLFSGTPCQVAGLKAYLGKEYENLYTVDLICHGVPSQKLWKKSIARDEQKMNSPMTAYEFRNKEKRGWDTNYKKTFRNGRKSYGTGKTDVFYKAFLKGEIYRESCYTCPYASMDRPGDLTVGDFWGIDKELPGFEAMDGASAVLVNSPKGEALYSALTDTLVSQPVSPERIARHNHNLVAPTGRSPKRNAMYLNIDQKPFSRMDIRRLHRPDLKSGISYLLPSSFKKTLKKLLRG